MRTETKQASPEERAQFAGLSDSLKAAYGSVPDDGALPSELRDLLSRLRAAAGER